MPPPTTWSTDDFSIATYLHSCGIPLRAARLISNGSRPRDYDFDFGAPADACEALALEYLSSGAYRFDQAQRALKKVVFGWRWRGPLAGRAGEWATEDLTLASYIVAEGNRMVGFRRTHPNRREYRFEFADPKTAAAPCSALALRFLASDAYRYDQSQRALKRLVFSVADM